MWDKVEEIRSAFIIHHQFWLRLEICQNLELNSTFLNLISQTIANIFDLGNETTSIFLADRFFFREKEYYFDFQIAESGTEKEFSIKDWTLVI